MVISITRTYFPEGTNGKLECDGKLICNTIELPWKMNETKVSCIPEGKYFIRKRYSRKFQWHLHLQNVPGRDLILIHPANNAKKELLGCIAPVTFRTGIAKGNLSRKALEKLKTLVFPILERHEEVKLIIKSTL